MKDFEKFENRYKNSLAIIFDNVSENQRSMEMFEGIPHMLPCMCTESIRVKVVGSINKYDQWVYIFQKIAKYVNSLNCKSCNVDLQFKNRRELNILEWMKADCIDISEIQELRDKAVEATNKLTSLSLIPY